VEEYAILAIVVRWDQHVVRAHMVFTRITAYAQEKGIERATLIHRVSLTQEEMDITMGK